MSELAAVVVLPRGRLLGRGDPIDPATVFIVRRNSDRVLGFDDGQGGVTPVSPATSGYQLELDVTVASADGRSDTYTQLALHPDHPRSVYRVLRAVDPADDLAQVYLQPGSTLAPPAARAGPGRAHGRPARGGPAQPGQLGLPDRRDRRQRRDRPRA